MHPASRAGQGPRGQAPGCEKGRPGDPDRPSIPLTACLSPLTAYPSLYSSSSTTPTIASGTTPGTASSGGAGGGSKPSGGSISISAYR